MTLVNVGVDAVRFLALLQSHGQTRPLWREHVAQTHPWAGRVVGPVDVAIRRDHDVVVGGNVGVMLATTGLSGCGAAFALAAPRW
jgi:hypothetical protein